MEINQVITSNHKKRDNMLSWINPYVRQSGNAVRGKWKLEERKLLDYLLVYIEKGEGLFRIDGKEYQATEKDLFWIPPDTIHYLEGISDIMVCPFIHFDLIYRYPGSHWEFTIPGGKIDLSEYQSLMHPSIPKSPLSILKGKYNLYNNGIICNLINRISILYFENRLYSSLNISGVMLEVLSEILRGIKGKTEYQPIHMTKMEKAAHYMKNNLQDSFLIEKAAWNAGFSESHFRKLFREFYGTPPIHFLQQIRITHAKELMTFSPLSLTKIARLCGYKTVHSFSKAFKKREGISPRIYQTRGNTAIL